MKETKRIVFIGGPGTGKTAAINALKEKGYYCFEEVSRQVTREAQMKGISQLFLSDPLLFSEKLLEGRIEQFNQASELTHDLCFYDRGIPEVAAYMLYKNEKVPEKFKLAEFDYRYDLVFLFPVWEEIYKSDNERYESLQEAKEIENFVRIAYKEIDYPIIEVPKDSIDIRLKFILKEIKNAFS